MFSLFVKSNSLPSISVPKMLNCVVTSLSIPLNVITTLTGLEVIETSAAAKFVSLSSLGSEPTSISTPSERPSPSVSAMVGSLMNPSSPKTTSSPSSIPSPSVSATLGSVLSSNSSSALRPSLSWSSKASIGSFGFKPTKVS